MPALRTLVAASVALALTAGVVGDAEARPRPRKAKKFVANKTFGLGIMLGAPTAISGKYFYGRSTAFDFGVGTVYRWRDRDGLHLHVDHLWHPVSLVSNPSFELPLYVGIGARIFNYDYRNDGRDGVTAIGARVPIGIAFDLNNVPMDIFFELAVVVDLLIDDDDSYGGDLHGAIGFRYYFN